MILRSKPSTPKGCWIAQSLKGVSLRAVQTIGGWSSLRMVERYAHVDDAELARAVRITHSHTDEATKAVTATEDDSAKKESAGGSK
jgi:hypothetical protein